MKVLKRDRRSIRQADLARHRPIAISVSVERNGSRQIYKLKNVFETAPRRTLSKDKVAPFLRRMFTAGTLSSDAIFAIKSAEISAPEDLCDRIHMKWIRQCAPDVL
jgi:hypothetical protein